MYHAHPERPSEWTQWTGYLDLQASGFVGRQVLSLVAAKGSSSSASPAAAAAASDAAALGGRDAPGAPPGAPSAAGLYAAHVRAMHARLRELFGEPPSAAASKPSVATTGAAKK